VTNRKAERNEGTWKLHIPSGGASEVPRLCPGRDPSFGMAPGASDHLRGDPGRSRALVL
jgi:hypothetical protein